VYWLLRATQAGSGAATGAEGFGAAEFGAEEFGAAEVEGFNSSGRLRSTDRGRGHQASGKNQQRNGGAAHQHISRKGNTTSIRPSPHLEVV